MIIQTDYEVHDGRVYSKQDGAIRHNLIADPATGEIKTRLTPEGRDKLSRLMKERWARRNAEAIAKPKRYFSPATRAKLSEAATRRWAKRAESSSLADLFYAARHLCDLDQIRASIDEAISTETLLSMASKHDDANLRTQLRECLVDLIITALGLHRGEKNDSE